MNTDLRQRFEAEKALEIRGTIQAISSRMILPLYFAFWLCDLLYLPERKWEFLALRCSVMPVHVITRWFLRSQDLSFAKLQRFSFFFVAMTALPISAMIYLSGDWASPYYAGLNLVALGSLAFIPWSGGYFAATVASIFLPYYAAGALISGALSDWSSVLVNSFFIFGTISISFIIRIFNLGLRSKEFESRTQLKEEIVNRDVIIQVKTQEAVKLAALSNQFSPQVVEAIRNGKIQLQTGVRRAQICAIFIDIVNSTERVTRGDKDKVNKAITMFMDDTIRTLLKYDITVDKFLGDGVLAFANDPIQYDDYVERVVQAALEIRQRVEQNQDIYIDCWMNKMQLRYGIAVGFANVGFYGNDRYYKSYTAIGPVINLASRLCASAEPNQIVASSDVIDCIDHGAYSVFDLGRRQLKGFEGDLIRVYEVTQGQTLASSTDEIDCPACGHGLLFLDSDSSGIFVMKCRSCGHIQKDALTPSLSTLKVA